MIIRNCSLIRGSYSPGPGGGCAEQGRGDLPGLGAGRDTQVGEPGFQQAQRAADGLGAARCGLQPHDLLVQELVVGVVAERGLQGSQGLVGVAGLPGSLPVPSDAVR